MKMMYISTFLTLCIINQRFGNLNLSFDRRMGYVCWFNSIYIHSIFTDSKLPENFNHTTSAKLVCPKHGSSSILASNMSNFRIHREDFHKFLDFRSLHNLPHHTSLFGISPLTIYLFDPFFRKSFVLWSFTSFIRKRTPFFSINYIARYKKMIISIIVGNKK